MTRGKASSQVRLPLFSGPADCRTCLSVILCIIQLNGARWLTLHPHTPGPQLPTNPPFHPTLMKAMLIALMYGDFCTLQL